MGCYSALTGLALLLLPPGRAIVLAYSTPLWVLPLAAWRLDERASRTQWFGVAAGLLGILCISMPSLRTGALEGAIAYCMLLAAAAFWAVSIVYVRGHQFAGSTLALAPWQMLVATALLLPLAMATEGLPYPPDTTGVMALAYVGPVATAFAYWAIIEVGRRLRASTVAMALLATPCLGIIVSALALGEMIDPSLIAGAISIAAGIWLSTRSPDKCAAPR
jgi:drug/metabolite transporter (DMT)-like permease